MSITLQDILNIWVALHGIGSEKWRDHKASLVVFVSDVNTGTVLGLEKTLAKHALTLRNDLSLYTKQVIHMIIFTLVSDRRLRVSHTCSFYCIQYHCLIIRAVEAVAVQA